jgi:hypothetical protein
MCAFSAVSVLYVNARIASAQFQMPDPKQMSGIPRPVDDLPTGSISVRLIRGELSNNITNFPVQLHSGSKVTTVKTDDAGRAQFDHLTPGATVKATADVDGEHLESQEFAVPAQGGIRLMLVATDREKAAADAAAAAGPAITGDVSLTNQSRIVMEPGDEVVNLYYVLDISNPSKSPVNASKLFMFDMPKGAVGTTLMEGSSKLATVSGNRVRVQGPFPPGRTVVQVACQLPAGSGEVNVAQKFPAKLDQLAVIVKKVGDATVKSPQFERQQEFPADNEVYIASTGRAVPAGQEIAIDVAGLPHHSSSPRWIALSLAMVIIVAGVFAARRPDSDVQRRAAERKRLVTKRDRLFNDLVKLEHDRRAGRVDDRRYSGRREELIAALEQTYGALDTDEYDAEPPDRGGVAAPFSELRAS